METIVTQKSYVIPKAVPEPLGNYRAVVLRNGIGFVSGQFPIIDGRLAFQGRVGQELSVAQGREAAAACALNVLGQLQKALGEDFGRVRLARVDGYIASGPDFLDQPAVLDGASTVFVSVLGERGEHARTVFAVAQLPQRAAIELVVTFSLDASR